MAMAEVSKRQGPRTVSAAAFQQLVEQSRDAQGHASVRDVTVDDLKLVLDLNILGVVHLKLEECQLPKTTVTYQNLERRKDSLPVSTIVRGGSLTGLTINGQIGTISVTETQVGRLDIDSVEDGALKHLRLAGTYEAVAIRRAPQDKLVFEVFTTNTLIIDGPPCEVLIPTEAFEVAAPAITVNGGIRTDNAIWAKWFGLACPNTAIIYSGHPVKLMTNR